MSGATDAILFCPCCFASEEDASWGGAVLPDHCTNCGAGGAPLLLPRWAVKSIRENASWVGKRYYPHDEDRERAEELAALRGMVPRNPNDVAEFVPWEDKPGGFWRVTRTYSGGRNISISGLAADTEEEALEKGHQRLRYEPAPATPGEETQDEHQRRS